MSKPAKPKSSAAIVYCLKCKREFLLETVKGVLIDAVIAYLLAARCPRCRAHRRWLQLL